MNIYLGGKKKLHCIFSNILAPILERKGIVRWGFTEVFPCSMFCGCQWIKRKVTFRCLHLCAYCCLIGLFPFVICCHWQVQDSLPLSIGFSSDKGPVCTLSNGVLFPKGHPFPSVKILTLHRTNTFHMEAFYVNSNELPSGLSAQIDTFTVCWLHLACFFL